ncbi:translocation/assembly module TamB domain-containing protein [Snodgrassella sp. CFCC 13594]|uniref:translocation/assembly module TamB domain-containing protein n=1 Tax=Snodgrassella sp. CFCC 13594 TaxID=1775559 RepID=UPI00082CE77C|nr:translocation/assembly module TamB domain-containing protein [Snodgrassella sp. CFCC 13594]
MTDQAAVLPNTTTPPATPPPAVPPKRRWLKRVLWVILIVFVLLSGSLSWLLGSQSGLRFGVLTLPSWFGVNIKADNLTGSVWRGFEGENWRIHTESVDIDIDNVLLDWNNRELWQRKLHIRRLEVGKLHMVSRSSAPEPAKPAATLPQSIRLPVAVNVDAIVLGGITIGEPAQTVLLPSQASYVYDHQNHTLNIAQLSTPWQNVSGQIVLNTQTPYALSGQVSGNGVLDKTAIQSQARFSGSLNEPNIQATIKGQNLSLLAEAIFKPYALQLNHKIVKVDLRGQNINPAAFLDTLPQADLNFAVGMQPDATKPDEINGTINVRNSAARPYNDTQHTALPFTQISGQVHIDNTGKVVVPNLTAQLLQQGQIFISGNIDSSNRHVDMTAQLQRIRSRDVLINELNGTLNGQIRVQGEFNSPQTTWQLATEKGNSNGAITLLTDENQGQQTLMLDKLAVMPNGGGSLNAKGSLALFQDKAVDLTVTSQNFNPGKLNSDFPLGRVNGTATLKGKLSGKQQQPELASTMRWQNSVLSGAPLAGKADLAYEEAHLSRANINLLLGQNRINSNGSFGKTGDKLNLDIYAPHLDLFGFGLKGLLTAKGFVAGEPKKLTANIQGSARQLQFNQLLHIQTLDFKLQGSPDINQPLNIQVDGKAIQLINANNPKQPTRIDAVSTHINGRGSQHQIQASGSMSLDGKPYRLNVAANGGLDKNYQWRGLVRTLDIAGAFNLKLLAPLTLEAGSEKVIMNHARWAAMGGSLNVNSLSWIKDKGLTTRGQANGLAVQELHNLITIPVKQNLVLAGDWDFAYNNNMHGYFKIRQQAGDVILPQREQALGLSNVVLDTRFQNGRINNHLSGNTRYGNVDAVLDIAQNYGNDISKAAISGHIQLDAPDLDRFRYLMPVGMQAKGSLHARAAISGTLNNPQLNGTLNGDNLYYREQNNGIILENGTLRSRFQGRRWLIDALTFKRRDGNVTLKGTVNLAGTTPDVDVTAHFDRYTILDQINRRLTLSGNSRLIYTVQRGVTLTGELKVDQGHFGFQKSGMPTLDDDVVVLGREKPKETQNTPISLNLALDLNNKFRFSGEGLDVLLGGTLVATAEPRQDIQVVGTVNIVRGQYKAYGQDLVIQRGSSISFVGPMDNPNLKIRAKRRYSQVGAGVEALGNLNSPRVNLVADEAMSDKDKLSWLILNRASSGSAGDEAAIAAAASAWLAGGLNDKLGILDEVGITSQQTRNSQTGELNPAEQVITVGKRLSNNLYLGYQYGIESATQTVRLTYQISRGLQTILKVGTGSFGGEMRYTVRFD